MRKYITGKEIFESGIMTSQELGYLCYADEVTAWHASGGAHYMGGSQYEEFKACACHSRTAIPFSFDFIEYERLEIEQDEDIGYFEALSKYEEELSNMLFKKAEIEKIIACRTCADGNTPTLDAGTANKVSTREHQSGGELKRVDLDEAKTITGGWLALDDGNEILRLGLMLMQRKPHGDIHKELDPTGKGTAKDYVQYRKKKFLNHAEGEGYDFTEHVTKA